VIKNVYATCELQETKCPMLVMLRSLLLLLLRNPFLTVAWRLEEVQGIGILTGGWIQESEMYSSFWMTAMMYSSFWTTAMMSEKNIYKITAKPTYLIKYNNALLNFFYHLSSHATYCVSQ
jgi:hypothetical protein